MKTFFTIAFMVIYALTILCVMAVIGLAALSRVLGFIGEKRRKNWHFKK